MINIENLHQAFANIEKMRCFEIRTTDGIDCVDLWRSEKGLMAVSEYGEFEVLLSDFDYCDNVNACLDMMLSELYTLVIAEHSKLGIIPMGDD